MKQIIQPWKWIRAFTLIELLAVIAIIGVLTVGSLPAFVGLSRGNRLNSGLLTLSGVMDLARQYAVGKNTYTWVLINPGGTGLQQGAQVALIASQGGADSIAWGTTQLDLPSPTGVAADLQMVDKIWELPFVRIINTQTVAISSLPASGAVAPAPLGTVNISIVKGGQKVNFTQAIQFTPTGEARVGGAVQRYVDLAILPQLKQGNADSPNQAVVRTAGLTGKTNIYRN